MQTNISSMRPGGGPLGQAAHKRGDKKGCWGTLRPPLTAQHERGPQRKHCSAVTSICFKRHLCARKGASRERGSIEAVAAAEAVSPAAWDSSRLDGKLKIIGASCSPLSFFFRQYFASCGSNHGYPYAVQVIQTSTAIY